MQCFVAYDDLFGWHGMGNTIQETLDDLAEVILEDYLDLLKWQHSMSQDLHKKLSLMRKYITHASKSR